MEEDTGTLSRGHCALRDSNRDSCTAFPGTNNLLVCVPCDRYNAPLTDQQISQLKAQPDVVCNLVAELISSRRREPLPFEFGALVSTVQRTLPFLGETRRPVNRIILNRYPREGSSVRLEISYGVLRDEKPAPQWGYTLESPRFLQSVPYGAFIAAQKLHDAGFSYVRNEHDVWEGSPPYIFTKLETVRYLGTVARVTLGIYASLTIQD